MFKHPSLWCSYVLSVEFREDAGANSGDECRRETSRTESDEDNAANNVTTVGFHKHHHIQLETQI